MHTPYWKNGLWISRFFGRLTAILVAIWAWKQFSNLTVAYPLFAKCLGVVGLLYALALLFPLPKTWPLKIWWVAFIGLIGLSMAMAVVCVGSVAYNQAEALMALQRARPPVFEGVLIFLGLLQLPTIFFTRFPLKD
jgi:cobalamin synthase